MQVRGIWLLAVAAVGTITWKGRKAYRGSQGYVMIYLGKSQVFDLYVVRISREQVAVTTNNYFWFLSPVGALARGTPDPSINMMHDKNNYADPHLKIGERSASFQDLKGETIHIEW